MTDPIRTDEQLVNFMREQLAEEESLLSRLRGENYKITAIAHQRGRVTAMIDMLAIVLSHQMQALSLKILEILREDS